MQRMSERNDGSVGFVVGLKAAARQKLVRRRFLDELGGREGV